MAEEHKYPMVEGISEFKRSLFDHQRTAIFRMEELEEKMEVITSTSVISTNIGIFSDEAGYGKTLSLLGLIYRDKFKLTPDTRIPNNMNGYTLMTSFTIVDKTMIVCPLSIILQWENEIKSNTSMDCVVIKNRKQITRVLPPEQIVIVTTTMYNEFITHNPTYIWKRLIVDEPDSLKIPSMVTPNYGFIWLVSSTIMYRTENRQAKFIKELTRIRNGDYAKFNICNPLAYVQSSVSIPPVNEIEHLIARPIMVRNALPYVSGAVRDMLLAGDIEGVMRSLSATKSSTLMEVLEGNLKKKKRLWTFRLNHPGPNLTEEQLKVYRIDITKKLKDIALELKSISEKSREVLQSDCPICCDTVSSQSVVTPCCQNIFCGKCLISWLGTNSSCPMCRANMGVNDMIMIDGDRKEEDRKENDRKENDRKEEDSKENELLSLQEKLHQLISHNRDSGRKWIIASNYENIVFKLVHLLRDFNCAEMKGSITRRNKILKKFKEGDIDVIILNSKYSGAGINLYMATDVVLYNRFESDLEYQCIHRGQRIGRTSPLNVHTFKEIQRE